MARTSKEERIYLEGMTFAARIAQERGLDALQKEIEFRGLNKSVLNVRREELIAAARGRSRKELMFVATAMAETMRNYLKLPPSVMKDYLCKFNEKIEEYRMNSGLFKADQDKLTRDIGLNAICAEFIEDGGQNDGNN